VIHKAGTQDFGLFLATAGGLSIGSHRAPRKPFSAFSLTIEAEIGEMFERLISERNFPSFGLIER
jgi:hypothetical protein